MTIKRWVLLPLICAAMISGLVGCGGGSSSVTTPPPAISIAFNPAPPAAMQVGTNSPLTAVVTNDSSNAGVDWSVTCGSSACGSFSPTHTASDVATTYTAPATVPSGGTVTVTAASHAEPTKFASATITSRFRRLPFLSIQSRLRPWK